MPRKKFHLRPLRHEGPREPGPHGVTEEMIKFSHGEGRRRAFLVGPLVGRTPRDRRLHGKARIKARKVANRRPLTSASDW